MVDGDEFIHRPYYHALNSGLVDFTLMLEDLRKAFHAKAYFLSYNHFVTYFMNVDLNGFYNITYFPHYK